MGEGRPQRTLVIASRGDGVVPLTQAEPLKDNIDGATLMVVDSNSHFMRSGPGSAEVSDRIRTFLSDAL